MIIDIEGFLKKNNKVTKVVINQTWGLGDILFIEPIYRYLSNLGLEVIAPIQDVNISIQTHIPYVNFKKVSNFEMDYERFDFGLFSVNGKTFDDTIYLPTRFSDQIFRDLRPHDDSASRYWMTDKYSVLGLDYKIWETIKLERDIDKEMKLKEIVLKDIDGEYDFCNSFYQNSLNITINLDKEVKQDLPIISMRKIDGFSMIDWSTIIQGSRKIHTVSTSLIYMIQSIYLPEKEYHIYPRLPERGFYTIEEFLPDYWIKHTKLT